MAPWRVAGHGERRACPGTNAGRVLELLIDTFAKTLATYI
jgi:hypothetical protein